MYRGVFCFSNNDTIMGWGRASAPSPRHHTRGQFNGLPRPQQHTWGQLNTSSTSIFLITLFSNLCHLCDISLFFNHAENKWSLVIPLITLNLVGQSNIYVLFLASSNIIMKCSVMLVVTNITMFNNLILFRKQHYLAKKVYIVEGREYLIFQSKNLKC
jgi:hypothetical protein